MTGEWLLRAGDVRDADAAFRRYLSLRGSSPDSLADVAARYLAVERWEPARDLLERALRADPGHRARLSLGVAYEKLGQDAEAEATYREAVRRRPDPYALNALGYFYAERAQRPGEALALLHRATELLPNDGSILDSLGWALYQGGDSAAAVHQLLLAVERIPSSGEIRFHLGAALAQQGMRKPALVELGKAVMLDPHLTGAREALAAVRAGHRLPMPLPYVPPTSSGGHPPAG